MYKEYQKISENGDMNPTANWGACFTASIQPRSLLFPIN